MRTWRETLEDLRAHPRTWLVTGAAGFIGSHLLETLLGLGQRVTALDNFSTGSRANLVDVRARLGEEAWSRLRFLEGDLRDLDACHLACEGADLVLQQAALGSVPRSIADPLATHASNVDGFLNLLVAARDAGVARFVFASSSSVYGDDPGLPKVETRTGTPLSPYALTKVIDEQYAWMFARTYGMSVLGLRYFNVFGPRQDPEGPYAAVIPRWIKALLAGDPCTIYGDGETSRDFCFVGNVVQANLRAALAPAEAAGRVYNVSCGDTTTLKRLYALLRDGLAPLRAGLEGLEPRFEPARSGEIRHSLADLTAIREALGYAPTHDLAAGLAETLPRYVQGR